MNLTGYTEKISDGLLKIDKQIRFKEIDVSIGVSAGGQGLEVIGRDGEYRIVYGEKSDFFRALALLCGKIRQGETTLDIREVRKFSTCGVMIDCSRNAVLKPESFKDILCKMACMGLNTAMLYTEDTYRLDNYPYFGYMRGAYTKDELRDLDKYALSLGIELIPCIQTLGHLKMALRWPFADNIKDCPDILLADEPKTYEFIEEMLKFCRKCFSTNKIHIGMDEAHGIGLGEYLEKHGFQNRFNILYRHLSKVVKIAGDLAFKPMMWSDMFFRPASRTGDDYDLSATIPENLPNEIPQNITMVYWDYYREEFDKYCAVIQKHKELEREIIFAGGIWTWKGMGVNYNKTFRTAVPALKACHKTDITNVIAAMWGDDGAEVNVYAALLGIQLYAEYTYYGEVSNEHLRERFALCTGFDMDTFLALEIDDYPVRWCYHDGFTVSKQVLYQDLLMGLFDKNFEGMDLTGHYRRKSDVLKGLKEPGELKELFDYQKQLLNVLAQKSDMGWRINLAYQKRDMAAINLLVLELEALYEAVEMLHENFRLLWLKTYKPQGLERIDLRFGGLLARIKVAARRLGDFTERKIGDIEELEEPRLMFGGENVKTGKSLADCQFYTNIASPAAGT